MTAQKKPRQYIDNDKLYDAFIEWYAQRDEAFAKGEPEPQPHPYISEAILKIPTRLASKGNFAGYSYREEMVGDAIENLVQYFRNFDPEKSKKPFAYFTQISYFAFLRRIEKEKKQSYVKHKILQNSDILEMFSTQDHDIDGDYEVSMVEIMKNSLRPELEEKFEKKKNFRGKKPKEPKFSIEDLLGEDEEINDLFYGKEEDDKEV